MDTWQTNIEKCFKGVASRCHAQCKAIDIFMLVSLLQYLRPVKAVLFSIISTASYHKFMTCALFTSQPRFVHATGWF